MSGYPNPNQFNTDYIGGTTTTRGNEYSTNISNSAHSTIQNQGITSAPPSTGLAPLRSVAPSTAMQQQQQQQSQQAPAQPQSLLYDISSFDPLQAQALQLSASAGLTPADLLAAAGAPGIAASQATTADGTTSVALGTPVAAGLSAHPATAYSQTLSQPQAPASTHGAPAPVVGAPVAIQAGQLQPIQPVPATAPVSAAQHPYIFIQPQQFAAAAAANAQTAPGAATFPAVAAPGQPSLLVPSSAGAVSNAAAAQAVAAAAALQGHPFLFNPALITAAAAQGVLQQHQPTAQKQPHHAQMATANVLAPTLILPSINPHQALSQQHSKKRPLGGGVVLNEIAPSVVSSATTPAVENAKKRTKKVDNAEEAKNAEDPAEKRRYERNLREQQRSSKISSQIKELREVLQDCNVPFKPNKYSILLKVVEYIKQLQSRAIMLDAEHKKLIATVRQTNEMIANAANNNNTAMSSTTGGVTDNESSDNTTQDAWQQGDPMRERRGDSDGLFVKGIDYRSVFEQCPTAFGIAALDGRILECNVEFQNLLGYTAREELLKQSLFNLVHNHQDIFRAMAQMLKTAEEPTPKNTAATATSGANDDAGRYWTGLVMTAKQNIKLSMNITLTPGDNGTPKFFSCALTNSMV